MEVIQGYIEKLVFRNTDNGYTVFNLNNNDGDLTCVGKFHFIEEGALLELEGEYVFEDNYFSLLPDEVRTVRFCPTPNAETEGFTVSGYTINENG